MASQLITDTGAVSGISGLRYASDSSGVLQILTGAGGVAVTLDANQVMTLGSALNEVQGADIASAATVNLTASTGNYVNVTGTTTITAITLAQGAERTVKFAGALTLTNGASLILPSGANITTAAGDVAIFRGEAAGVVRCVAYTKANGQAIVASASAFAGKGGQVFTASGTFTVPAGVSAVKVTVIGGGGNGGNATNTAGAGGGGGGGASVKYVTGLTAGGTVTVTVGGIAGTSSFGAYCSATGGATAANASSGGSGGGAGGTGTGGDLNITGSSGLGGYYINDACVGTMTAGGNGGAAGGGKPSSASLYVATFYGATGSGGNGWYGGGGIIPGINNQPSSGAATGYGNGGAGASRTSTGTYTGGAGTGGIVIVEW
jgi:hypothetical protein